MAARSSGLGGVRLAWAAAWSVRTARSLASMSRTVRSSASGSPFGTGKYCGPRVGRGTELSAVYWRSAKAWLLAPWGVLRCSTISATPAARALLPSSSGPMPVAESGSLAVRLPASVTRMMTRPWMSPQSSLSIASATAAKLSSLNDRLSTVVALMSWILRMKPSASVLSANLAKMRWRYSSRGWRARLLRKPISA